MIGHPQDFSPVSGLISLGIPLSVLLPASQPMRSPWTWSSGYEFHAHADLPVLLNTQNLQSVVQVRNTANRGLMLCNAGLVMQKCTGTRTKSLLHCTGHPAARFTQICTLERSIAQNNRHRRLNTQQRSCLNACPRRHTPIARSQVRQERALDAGSLRTMLQHHAGRPASSWARCCPRLRHLDE